MSLPTFSPLHTYYGFPGKRPQKVCVRPRGVAAESFRDLGTVGSREMMVVMKVGIVVMVVVWVAD